jgi:hypothetical protein
MSTESRATLFIYLHEDDSNSIDKLIAYIEKQCDKVHFAHAGVIQLAQNVLLFDKTKHHGLLTILLSEAQKRDRSYLLLPVEATSSLLAGTPSKDIQGILESYGVPFCPSLKDIPLYKDFPEE